MDSKKETDMQSVEKAFSEADHIPSPKTENRLQVVEEMRISDDEMSQLAETIPTLNFIELHSMRRDLSNMVMELTSAKTAVETYLNLTETAEDGEIKDKIAKADASGKAKDALKTGYSELQEEAEKFSMSYEDTIQKTEKLQNLIDNILKEKYEDVDKTTSFLTQCTMEMLHKKIKSIGSETEESSSYKKELESMVTIFENRGDTSALQELLSDQQVKLALTRLHRDLRNDPKGIKMTGAKTAVSNTLSTVVNIRQLQNAEKCLNAYIHNDEVVFYLIYALYSIYLRHMNRRDIRYKWIELFILNCSDIHMGIYDLNEGPDAYLASVKELGDMVRGMLHKK